jgi:hypothetical protein
MRTTIALVLMLAACGGGEDAGLVGTWHNSTRDYSVTYHAGGAYEPSAGETGRWSVEGDRVTIERNSQWVPLEHFQFVVDGDLLLTGVLRPQGAVDGMVGVWQGTSFGTGPTDAQEDRLYRLTLRADGTGEYHTEINSVIRNIPIAWSQGETAVVLDTGLGTFDYFIGPDVLGSAHWTREP